MMCPLSAGDVGGTQTQCRTAQCPSWQFSPSQCTAYSDTVCVNCTQWKTGYFKTYNCSLAMDSGWQLCSPGFFCDGSGTQTPCPINRTSPVGADQASECFCKVRRLEGGLSHHHFALTFWRCQVGTLEDKNGICIPMRCPNTIQDAQLPGPSLVSPYYMTLDSQTKSSTACLPCGDPLALTFGTGIEISSCACPPAYYAVLNSTGSLRCLPCAAQPPVTCSDPLHQRPSASAVCSRTLAQSSACQCAIPPFSGLNDQQSAGNMCQYSCSSGFLPTANARINQGAAAVSGSPIYIQQAWQPILSPSAQGSNIAFLATTGQTDDSVLTQQYRPEYVFWTTGYAAWPFVFALPLLVASEAPVAWEVYSDPVDWAGNLYSLAGLAVSRWDASHNSLYAAAAVLKSGQASFVTTLQIKSFNGQDGVWGSAAPRNLTILQGQQAQEIISIVHTTNTIGSAQSQAGGFFYIAYNLGGLCGGLMLVSPVTMLPTFPAASICDAARRRIEALTLNIDKISGYPAVYVVKGGGALYQLDLPTGQLPDTPLIPSAGAGMALFATSQNIFLSVAALSGGMQAADTLEWTWVSIPGMPSGTAPSPMLGVTGLTPTTSLLVTAYGSQIYSIRATICPGHYYWDGVACMPQTCVKIPHCSSEKVFVNSQCVCKDGTYQLPTLLCSPCPLNSYCSGGLLTACPNKLYTLNTQSASIDSCICANTGQFFSEALSACQDCPQNYWCPNRWLSLPCPGTSALGSLRSQFPTQCACQAGFTGPGCAPCPSGYYCPGGTGATAFNMAGFLIGASQDDIPIIQAALYTYFTTPGSTVASVKGPGDLSNILSIQVVQATNRSDPGLMVLVQLPDTTGSNWGQVLRLTFTQDPSSNRSISMLPSTGIIPMQSVNTNPPTQCLTGKVPATPIASSCICAAGYETKGQQCSPCTANMFKAAAGAGACSPCPLGLVSSATGASACIPEPVTVNGGGGNGVNTLVLAGGVGGGVLGLLLILFFIYYFCMHPNTAAAGRA